MAKLGRGIVAYHPEIRVKRGDQVMAIKLGMDDWYTDDEILGKLAVLNPGCKTVGDLVVAIETRNGELSCGDGCVLSCCIEECGASVSASGVPVRDEGETI